MNIIVLGIDLARTFPVSWGWIPGATPVASDPPSFRGERFGEEFYNFDRKLTAEGFADWPRNYGDIPQRPQLRPALPGDVGSLVVRMERDLSIAPPLGPAIRPNPEVDAPWPILCGSRNRPSKRMAGVFFQISAWRELVDVPVQPPAGQGAPLEAATCIA